MTKKVISVAIYLLTLSSCLAPTIALGVDARDAWGRSALHRAVEKGDQEAVSVLIEAGVDIEARNTWGYTPLHQAIDENDYKIVDMLIRAGADIEARDARGNTPLHRAALSENEEAINALLDAGANARAEVPLQETRKAKIRKARKDAEAFIQIVEAMLTPRYFIPDDSHIYRSETWWRLYELEQ